MNLKVYTVGAISGLSYEECVKQFDVRIARLKEMGYDVFYPMLGKSFLRNETSLRAEGYPDCPLSCNHAIVRVDFWRVDMADILFVDFTNATDRVSIGSVAEMSRGYDRGKLIVTVMQKENVHRHAFVMEMSSVVFETLEEAYEYFGTYMEMMVKK
jgi:hypothetical protein